MTLGHRIRTARLRCGLTQQEVADHFDISREAVQQWESDKWQPRGAKLQALAKLLQATPQWLVTGEDKDVLSAEEQRFLALFRAVPRENHGLVLQLLQTLSRPPEAEHPFHKPRRARASR